MSLLLFVSLFLVAFPSTTISFDIAKVLAQNPSFSIFNNYLAQTQLAPQINSRETITVLAVDNAAMSAISGKSMDTIRKVLSIHVILDYFDVSKLRNLNPKSVQVTTLYQTSGLAINQDGFLNLTQMDNGAVTFGSSSQHSNGAANLINGFASEPYNLSVIQVSSLIIPSTVDSPPAHSNSPSPSSSNHDQSNSSSSSPLPSSSNHDHSNSSSPSPSPSSSHHEQSNSSSSPLPSPSSSHHEQSNSSSSPSPSPSSSHHEQSNSSSSPSPSPSSSQPESSPLPSPSSSHHEQSNSSSSPSPSPSPSSSRHEQSNSSPSPYSPHPDQSNSSSSSPSPSSSHEHSNSSSAPSPSPSASPSSSHHDQSNSSSLSPSPSHHSNAPSTAPAKSRVPMGSPVAVPAASPIMPPNEDTEVASPPEPNAPGNGNAPAPNEHAKSGAPTGTVIKGAFLILITFFGALHIHILTC